MKKNIAFVITLLSLHVAHAQSIDKIINATEVKRIEQILSADDMQGRRTFTPGIEKASAFIESEFKKTGLQTFNGAANYRQDFLCIRQTWNLQQLPLMEKKLMIPL